MLSVQVRGFLKCEAVLRNEGRRRKPTFCKAQGSTPSFAVLLRNGDWVWESAGSARRSRLRAVGAP